MVCFIVDDGPDDEYGIHWSACIPKWLIVMLTGGSGAGALIPALALV